MVRREQQAEGLTLWPERSCGARSFSGQQCSVLPANNNFYYSEQAAVEGLSNVNNT